MSQTENGEATANGVIDTGTEPDTEDKIIYRREGPIVHIVLNRPRVLNALSDEMVIGLQAALDRLDNDPEGQIAILSGRGRAFCSGADVRQRQLRPREELERIGAPSEKNAKVQDLPFRYVRWKPMIAAVHGFAVGAGLRLALQSELIVAAAGTKFQITETTRGLDPNAFYSLLTWRGMGEFATEVALTGRFWTAEEASQRGMVTAVCEQDQLLPTATALAERILANPPLAVRAIVRGRRLAMEETYFQAKLRATQNLHLSEDFSESAHAFAEKRTPTFRGR